MLVGSLIKTPCVQIFHNKNKTIYRNHRLHIDLMYVSMTFEILEYFLSIIYYKSIPKLFKHEPLTYVCSKIIFIDKVIEV